MDRKTLTITSLVLAALLVTGSFLYVRWQRTSVPEQTPTSDSAIASEREIRTDEFSVLMPVGWQHIPYPSTRAMMAYSDEQYPSEAFAAIEFKSYLAISKESRNEKTFEEYLSFFRHTTQLAVPGLSLGEPQPFGELEGTSMMEGDITRDGAQIKVALVFIPGAGSDVWIFTFNTPEVYWSSYQTLLEETARSFTLNGN
jgi:hypothetical protein